ncbi:MAG TPA: nuclear transport factor 2 family protein [Thermoanaerobaculia bacterium]|jgi:ketosteroid isomerase-like protein
MRRLLLLLFVFTACATAPDHSSTDVERTIDAWHRAAAEANEDAYFGAMSPDFVFLGTDATERWDLPSFRAFAHPYFAKGTAWTFTPRERHVMFSPRGDVAWFDEKLQSASYGECRGTGVVRKVGGEWKIAHYNLTIPIPNDLAKSVVGMIQGKR